MDAFRRGTLTAAIVLSGILIVGMPVALVGKLGLTRTLIILVLALCAIWGSRLGVNAVYRGVFAKGQEDERGKDTDFI